MRQASLFMFLGPVAVLYLVADVASGRGGLTTQGSVLAALPLLLSAAPFVWRPSPEAGSRTVAGLGMFWALLLVRLSDPLPLSLSADLALVVGLCGVGACLLDLALRVPEPMPFLHRGPQAWPSVFAAALGLAVLLAEVLSLLPALSTPMGPLLWPALTGHLAGAFLALASVAALALRVARRLSHTTPDARAGNGWALLGLWPLCLALVVLGVVAVQLDSGARLSVSAPRHVPLSQRVGEHGALSLGVLGFWLLFCHGRLVIPEQRVKAAPFGRQVVAASLTAAMVFALGGLLFVHVSDSFAMGGYSALLMAVSAVILYRAVSRVVERRLSPDGGRLTTALSEADLARLRGAQGLSECCRLALSTLHAGCGGVRRSALRAAYHFLSRPVLNAQALTDTPEVRLYLIHPALEARLDAAQQVHLRRRSLSPAIEQELRRTLGRPLIRSQLCALRVRAPRLRPLIAVLEEQDLLCVVPLLADGDLEGALLLPRGQRRDELSLEELQALQAFALPLAAQLATLAQADRARARAQRASERAQSVEARNRALREDVGYLQAQVSALSAGLLAGAAAKCITPYSPAMRALLVRIAKLSATDSPVLFMAESGVWVEPVAAELHRLSARSQAPFLVMDCAQVAQSDVGAMIHGEEGDWHNPGLLRLAARGTVLLLNITALPFQVQVSLADALTTGMSRAQGEGSPAYEVDCRLLASARSDVAKLARKGACEGELARKFAGQQLRVPPLRDRAQDMEALIFAALSRACARLAKPPIGLSAAAQQTLRSYHWPYNELQLEQCMERAARNCYGPRVEMQDLPSEVKQDPYGQVAGRIVKLAQDQR